MIQARRLLVLIPSAFAVALAACGGGNGAIVPGTQSATDVQASGIKQSYVGKMKCDPKGHNRPFTIEWDATESSTFEARAKSDVLFVKYENCELTVLDNCRNDSIPGAYGSYRAPEWTSGSVEVMEIANEGDLFAKLPLGVGTLGGRIQGGEKFRMEYFVSGTRTATRDKIYKSDLKGIAGCSEATHFVYGYNLGAFALGATTNLKGEVEGTLWGVGGGASRAKSSKAEKTGGLLSSCRGESAKDTETCKTPIRLSLREISDGDNPDQQSMVMPDTPSAMNLAGKLKAQTEKEKRAQEHMEQATAKHRARDGKGCLAELDMHDKLDPRPGGLSTSPAGYPSHVRAQCLMLTGQCPAGQSLLRKAMQTQQPDQPASFHDAFVKMMTAKYCQGNNLSDADKLARAQSELHMGSEEAKDLGYCRERINTINTLMPGAAPKDPDDHTQALAKVALEHDGPGCLARAGACEEAWALYSRLKVEEMNGWWKNMTPQVRQASIDQMMGTNVKPGFNVLFPRCKGKAF